MKGNPEGNQLAEVQIGVDHEQAKASLGPLWAQEYFPERCLFPRSLAEDWIAKNRSWCSYSNPLTRRSTSGLWRGLFHPRKEEHFSSDFIENLSSSKQDHHHYSNGEKEC
jgi:hypothetical protein